jgi:two-component system cell cycle sensor histidine kinase PleC
MNALDASLGACVRTDCPTLYLRLGPDGRLVETNGYTRSLLGERAIVGAPWDQLVVNFDATALPRERAARGASPQTVNFMSFAELPVTVRCTFRDVGDETAVMGAVDVLEHEALRKELIHSTQALSNLTRELQRSNAELERLSALRSLFIGMAAHDLRSPLSVMLSTVHVLEEEATGETKEDLATLSSSAQFMRRLVDDFLSVALIDAGRLEVKLEPVLVSTVIDTALKVTARASAHRKCLVKVEPFDRERATVVADGPKLEQVLMNLLNNAFEHSPPGAEVTVRFEAREREALLHVSDRGRGVATEVERDLFKAFVHGGGKSLGARSTGLGLTISKLIVEAHGGSLTTRSSGEGATFTVALPAGRTVSSSA